MNLKNTTIKEWLELRKEIREYRCIGDKKFNLKEQCLVNVGRTIRVFFIKKIYKY